jgi:hypothetical protein
MAGIRCAGFAAFSHIIPFTGKELEEYHLISLEVKIFEVI